MSRLTDALLMRRLPASYDVALLLLRIAAMVSLFLKHGLEKVVTFSSMASHFPDPLHIGAVPSLIFAMIGDSICSVLIMIGLGTRWAALIAFVNIFVAWILVHHLLFFGHSADHGELIVLYLAILGTILVAGPGRYSVDSWLRRKI